MKNIIINQKTIYYGQSSKENTDLVRKFQQENIIGFWYHLFELPSPHCFFISKDNLSKDEMKTLGLFLLEKVKNKIPKDMKEFYLDYCYISDVVPTKSHGKVYVNTSRIKIK